MNIKKMMQRKKIGINLSIIFRATSARIQECHNDKRIKFSMAQMPVLSFLLDTSKKIIAQDFITKSLGIDKASTTRAVKTLSEEGYVKRERDKRDKRAYNLSLTKTGKSLGIQVLSIMKSWTDIIYDGVSEEEINQLENITNKMVNNIKKYKEEKKYEHN